MSANLGGAGRPPGTRGSSGGTIPAASGRESLHVSQADDGDELPKARGSGRWAWRATGWAITIALAAIISNYVVPGAHKAFAAGACYGKYAFFHQRYTPESSDWRSYGVTWVSSLPGNKVLIRPAPSQGAANEWFGAVLPVTRACNYQVSLSAELIGPRDPAAVRFSGYGYGIGVRGSAVNGIPVATTTQFDPTFGGLRLVPIPADANKAGFNATPFAGVRAGTFHRWTISVSGSTAYVVFDGKGYQALHLTAGDDVLIRVWNCEVIIRSLTITPSMPSLA